MVLAMMLMVSSWLKTLLLCQGAAEIELYWIIERSSAAEVCWVPSMFVVRVLLSVLDDNLIQILVIHLVISTGYKVDIAKRKLL